MPYRSGKNWSCPLSCNRCSCGSPKRPTRLRVSQSSRHRTEVAVGCPSWKARGRGGGTGLSDPSARRHTWDSTRVRPPEGGALSVYHRSYNRHRATTRPLVFRRSNRPLFYWSETRSRVSETGGYSFRLPKTQGCWYVPWYASCEGRFKSVRGSYQTLLPQPLAQSLRRWSGSRTGQGARGPGG